MKVQVTRTVYIYNRRFKPGSIIQLESKDDFRPKSMLDVDGVLEKKSKSKKAEVLEEL